MDIENMDVDTLASIGAAYLKGKGGKAGGKGTKGKGKGTKGSAAGKGQGANPQAAAATAAAAAAAAAANLGGAGAGVMQFRGECWWCGGLHKHGLPRKACRAPQDSG